jgi:hypothetical protein
MKSRTVIPKTFVTMKIFYFYDKNFKPLRDRVVESLEEIDDGFVTEEFFLEDLGVMPNRAGGGLPTYLLKAAKIKESLDKVDDGEVYLFTDVDIQFLKPCRHLFLETMNAEPKADVAFQREFNDIGVNIGVIAIRKTEATMKFWAEVLREIEATQQLDQRVVNNLLYSERATKEFGVTWRRLPELIWASSMAFSGPPPEGFVLHHANFTSEKAASSDPSIKLNQMAEFKKFSQGANLETLDAFVKDVQEHPTMLNYRERHFGAMRPGPEWTLLDEGHIARPGGKAKTLKKARERAEKEKQNIWKFTEVAA